jgi:glycosyltransferase involved in cell wall biosynthesis
MRDFVYRFQRRRGFGRLTMHALHVDEEWFCRAAWRRISSSRRRPDVVHAHALHQAARLRRHGIPVVINLPGAPNSRYTNDLQQASALVADGWAADHLPSMLGRRVDRVPKGVDAGHFRPDGPSRRSALGLDGKRVVLTVARLVPIKNLALLIDAMAILRRRVPAAHLVIVGEGPSGADLRQHAAASNLADAVTFAGEIAHADTPALYRAADVFALSSDFDNSPNVILEAMACGLPIVTTDVGGVRDFVDAAGGRIVPAKDAEALAHALQEYLDDPVEARAAGATNRLRASTAFSWRVSAQKLLDVYRRVIAAEGHAAA